MHRGTFKNRALGGLVLGLGFAAAPAYAHIVAHFGFSGPANAAGELEFTIRAPTEAQACGGQVLFAHTQPYDAVGGGPLPTTAEEIAVAVAGGLVSAAPPEFQVDRFGVTFIRIRGVSFDVCLEGDGIVLMSEPHFGNHVENGVVVTGTFFQFVPALGPIGVAVLTLSVLAAGAWVLRRRLRHVPGFQTGIR